MSEVFKDASRQTRGRRGAKHDRDRVDGILLIDKPVGVTSNGALQQCKRLLNARKAGHTGSLDPIATGLLPLCFGECTKLSGFLLGADKGYEAVLQLGASTTTGDAEGDIVESYPVNVDEAQLERVLDSFRGKFSQVPPMYSALKRNGQPLYKLARQGIEVEREPRDVEVKQLSGGLSSQDPTQLRLRMLCSSGFYVRSLAFDIGAALGCGAHVISLRRYSVGQFDVAESITVAELESLEDAKSRQAKIIPGDRGLSHLPEIQLSVDAAYYLCRGQSVRPPERIASGLVRLYAPKAGFLGLGQVLEDGRVAPKRLFQSL